MKKKVFGRKLSRDTDTRKALFRAIVRSLIMHDSVTTTKAKAKAVQGMVDTLVKLSKDKSVVSQRKLFSVLANDRVTAELLNSRVAGFTSDRVSGFTRLINLPPRKGDLAAVVRMEWVEKGTLSNNDKKTGKSNKKEVKKVMQPEKKGLAKVLDRAKKKVPKKETKQSK